MSQAWVTKFAGGDQPVWLSAAVVTKHAGEAEHWRINDELDLEVQVVTSQHAVPIVAIMGGQGAQGVGFWRIPSVGDQVIVAHPDDFEGDAIIVALLPTSSVPADLTETVLVLRAPAGGKVHVHDGAGQGPLATKADIDALRTWVAAQFSGAGHVHGVSGSSTNSTTPVTAPGATPPNAAGTQVLEAK